MLVALWAWLGVAGGPGAAETGEAGATGNGFLAVSAEDDWDDDGDWDDDEDWDALFANPFVGREIGSAREALDVLLAETGLGAFLTYEAVEAPDPEAVTLRGVVLAVPDQPLLQLAIGRIVISDLDLDGLGAPDGPSRYRIALEAIDYGALAGALRSFMMLPLPELEDGTTLTLAYSLLPAAMGEGRMTAVFLGQLDRQLGLSFEVTASPPPGAASLDPFAAEEIAVDGFVFELADWGFLGAMMREQAAEEGQSLEAFIAEAEAEMREALAPMPPGSPAAAVHDAVVAMFADLDRPGVLRFSLVSDRPRPLEELFEALAEAETLEADGLSFAITYLPME